MSIVYRHDDGYTIYYLSDSNGKVYIRSGSLDPISYWEIDLNKLTFVRYLSYDECVVLRKNFDTSCAATSCFSFVVLFVFFIIIALVTSL